MRWIGRFSVGRVFLIKNRLLSFYKQELVIFSVGRVFLIKNSLLSFYKQELAIFEEIHNVKLINSIDFDSV